MGTLISVLIIIVCLFLILVVLIQNSKGGGLASSFGSSNQVMGVKKTADVVEKITWGLAIALLVLSVVSTSFNKSGGDGSPVQTESATKKTGAEAIPDNGIPPAAPAQPNPGGLSKNYSHNVIVCHDIIFVFILQTENLSIIYYGLTIGTETANA